ncbi:MAG: hypothetical protein Q9163_004382 [Psora crenata]
MVNLLAPATFASLDFDYLIAGGGTNIHSLEGASTSLLLLLKPTSITDPKYLSHPLDAYVIGQSLLHLQRVARTPPLSKLPKDGGTVYQPGFYELNEGECRSIREKQFGVGVSSHGYMFHAAERRERRLR